MPVANATSRFARPLANRLLTDLSRKLARTAKASGPGAVHDLRVAIRRFQQVLTAFKAGFPAYQRKKIRRKLKQVMDPAGDVRDFDIAAILIRKLEPESASQFHTRLQKDRKAAALKLARFLRGLLDRELPRKWRAGWDLSHTEAKNGASQPKFPPAAQELVREMASDFLRLGEKATHPDTSARQVHHFRIASKKFRYTLELVEPFYGGELSPWLEAVKDVQSILGDANDCEIVRQMMEHWNTGQELIAKLEKRRDRKLKKFRRKWAAMPEVSDFPRAVPVKPASKSGVPRRGMAVASAARRAVA